MLFSLRPRRSCFERHIFHSQKYSAPAYPALLRTRRIFQCYDRGNRCSLVRDRMEPTRGRSTDDTHRSRLAYSAVRSRMMHVRTGVTPEVERKVWRTSRMGYWKIPLMGDGGDISGTHTSKRWKRKGHRTDGRMGSDVLEICIRTILALTSPRRSLKSLPRTLCELSERFTSGFLLPRRP